jgi:hypothetical protein
VKSKQTSLGKSNFAETILLLLLQPANYFFTSMFSRNDFFRTSIFIVCFFVFLPGKSQLILPTLSNSFDPFPNFNAELIKKYHIKNITFDILDKKDYQPGKDQGLVQHFDFDTAGRITRFYYTVISKMIVKETYVAPVRRKRRTVGGYTKHEDKYIYDTVSTRFYYDTRGRMILKRYNEGTYYESTYYDYDEENRMTRELRCKETNVHPDKNLFTLGVQSVISEEKFEYVSTGQKQYKKKCLNDEGRVFREVIVNLNEGNKPAELTENFTVTWISQKSRFWYTPFGQLAQKTFETNTDGTQAIRDTFEYDNKGNITWEKQYKNGVLLNERSYLFVFSIR